MRVRALLATCSAGYSAEHHYNDMIRMVVLQSTSSHGQITHLPDAAVPRLHRRSWPTTLSTSSTVPPRVQTPLAMHLRHSLRPRTQRRHTESTNHQCPIQPCLCCLRALQCSQGHLKTKTSIKTSMRCPGQPSTWRYAVQHHGLPANQCPPLCSAICNLKSDLGCAQPQPLLGTT